MLKKFLLMLMLLCSAGLQALTLDELQVRFSQMDVVRAGFVQKRQIQDMAQPLVSSGRMLMDSQLGLWWQQEKPFVMTAILTDQQMVQVTNKQAPQIITVDSNPQMFQLNLMLRGLFNANRTVLEENFSVNFSDLGGGNWRLNLKPVKAPLDKLFHQIELQGSQYLEEIKIFDKQGDLTQIELTSEAGVQAPLTDEERAYFVY